MTQAYVQKTVKFQANGVSSIASASITPASGNQLVATVAGWSDSTGGSPTTPWSMSASDGTNTWTNSLAQGSSNEYARGLIATALNVANTAVTVTITASSPSGQFWANGNIVEFSGTATSSALDSCSAASSVAASSTSATATTSGSTAQADELIVALLVDSTSSSNCHISDPASSGYTSIGVEQDANSTIGYQASYKIVSSTGTQTAGWTFDAFGDPGVWAIAAYKAAAGGGGSSELPTLIMPPMRSAGR